MTTWKTPSIGLKFEPDFIAASAAYGLPNGLLSRVAWQESRYNPDAKSPAGALGIMQIIPRWHPGVDPMNPKEAIPYAAKYLRENYNRFGSWDKALAAYNWGPTALAKAIADVGGSWKSMLPTETKNYVADITSDVPATVA